MSASKVHCGPTGEHPAAMVAARCAKEPPSFRVESVADVCGRMMQVGYSGTERKNCPRYICGRNKQLYGGERGCQSIGGRRLERRVLDEVFVMLEPVSLAATARALEEADANHRQRITVFELAVERARFEAERARRQFDAVEPENRLVARTLERSFGAIARQHNDRLRRTSRPSGSVNPRSLTEEEVAWLGRAGADVRAIFDAPIDHVARTQATFASPHCGGCPHRAQSPIARPTSNIIWQGGAKKQFHLRAQPRLVLTSGQLTRTRSISSAGWLSATTTRRSLPSCQSKSAAPEPGCLSPRRGLLSLRVSRKIPAFQPPENVTPRR